MARKKNSLASAVGDAVSRLAETLPAPDDGDRPRPVSGPVAAALAAVAGSAVRNWARKRRPPLTRIIHGAAAGVGAAALIAAGKALVGRRTPPADFVDELFAGAGRGIVYTSVLDPVLPGPPAVRGALMGTAEYLAAPWGGVFATLRSLSPVDRIPVVGALLEAGDDEDDPYLAYLLYGVALGLLVGDPED